MRQLIFGTKVEIESGQHPKCKGHYDEYFREYDCDYKSYLTCEECKYGLGRKDPEAKCNQED